MKNKHLVLLFVGVLLVGLVSRWLPVRYRTLFESRLFRWEEKDVSRMTVSGGGRPDLLFERLEEGWGVEQEARATVVQEAVVSEMLGALTGIGTFELVKTGRPDTLGFVAGEVLPVRLYRQKHLLEALEIGGEGATAVGACTYIRLPEHGGVYRVPGHLRHFFARSLQDFRPKTLVSLAPDAVRRITVAWPNGDSLVLNRADSAGRWVLANDLRHLSADSVHAWLALFERLKNSPFADYFDESRETETLFAGIVLEAVDTVEILRIFYLEPPDVPEEPADLRRRDRHFPAAFVVHSSANPYNYFALPDTNLVRILCFGLVQPPDSNR